MANDNTVKIGLNLDHQAAGVQLSKAALDIEYPSMDRDVGNALQFEIGLMTLLRLLRMAVQQCAEDSGAQLPVYQNLIGNIEQELATVRAIAAEAAEPSYD
jgi:hypothetical protein